MKAFFKYTFAPIAIIVISVVLGFGLYCYNTIDYTKQRLETNEFFMCFSYRMYEDKPECIKYLEDLKKAKSDLLSGRSEYVELRPRERYSIEGDKRSLSITDLRDQITDTEKEIEDCEFDPETYKQRIRETYRDTPVFLRKYIDFNSYALKANIAGLDFDN